MSIIAQRSMFLQPGVNPRRFPLNLIPTLDNANSVISSGQAYTKVGTTLISGGSGWDLANDKLSGLIVQGGNVLIRQPAGFTIFVQARSGSRNSGREANIYTTDDRDIESSGLWVEASSDTKLTMLLYIFLVRTLTLPNRIIAIRESFVSPTSTGPATPDTVPFDLTVPHVFVARYDRSKTGDERSAVFIDGARMPIYPPWSSTETTDSGDDGSAPAVYELSADHNVINFGPHSGYSPTISSNEYSPERMGACFVEDRPLSDGTIAAVSAWIKNTYPLSNV